MFTHSKLDTEQCVLYTYASKFCEWKFIRLKIILVYGDSTVFLF